MDDATRQRDLDRLRTAHADLVRHLEELAGTDGGDPAAPSLLPRWTRGHVLTHLARNADSHARVLRAAEHGAVVEQYEGGDDSRAADIERGAGRDWSTLVDDVRTASAALEGVIAQQTRWDLAMPRRGDIIPHTDLRFRRWRETLVHHADLGDPGFTPEDWPIEYVREELRRLTMRWDARRPMGATGLPPQALAAPELTRVRWLMGRADIDGLDPAGVF